MQSDFLERYNSLIEEIDKNKNEKEFLLMELNNQVLFNLVEEYNFQDLIYVDLETKENV